jgi:hypothetical protein
MANAFRYDHTEMQAVVVGEGCSIFLTEPEYQALKTYFKGWTRPFNSGHALCPLAQAFSDLET